MKKDGKFQRSQNKTSLLWGRGKIGKPGYLNKNCWLAKTLNYSPANRCQYCELKFHNCLFSQYLRISLISAASLLVLSFLIEREVSRLVIISIFVFVIVYGYFFNKSTEKIIEANFAQRKVNEELKELTKTLEESRKELEEAKFVLEIKVAARTRELKGLAASLDKQVKERTEELQERVKELERFHSLTVGRELKMAELKEEIKKWRRK